NHSVAIGAQLPLDELREGADGLGAGVRVTERRRRVVARGHQRRDGTQSGRKVEGRGLHQWTRLPLTAIGWAPLQTTFFRSSARRDSSFKVRGTPVTGSITVVPLRNADRVASLPGTRGVICRKNVLVSAAEWQPLQVLIAK